MAPRTRSGAFEKLAIQKLVASGLSVNTAGFPALPNELYWEILSHLPALAISDSWVCKEMDPYRQLTLYYLSQTCRSLRKFFLRFAWERIEVFKNMWTPVGKLSRGELEQKQRQVRDQRILEEILRQLETVVVRNPDLRQYVSIVRLSVPESSQNLLPKIAQNLSLFPNLHCLQLKITCRFRHFRLPSHPDRIFSKFRYPTVHTLDLCRNSPHRDILRACPNTRHFSFYKDVSARSHVESLLHRKCTRLIEKLGVLVGLPYYLADIIKGFPRLRDLSLDRNNLKELGITLGLDSLSSLPLHTIRLRFDLPVRRSKAETRAFVTVAQEKLWIELAKGTLAKCPQHEVAKRVIVVKSDKSEEIHSV